MGQTKEINDPRCTLSDKELVEKVNSIIQKLCETGGKSWSLRVPVDFNNDPDMLIIEMGKRLLESRVDILEDKKLYTEQNMLDLLQVCEEAMVIGTSVFVDRKAREFIKSLTTENGK